MMQRDILYYFLSVKDRKKFRKDMEELFQTFGETIVFSMWTEDGED